MPEFFTMPDFANEPRESERVEAATPSETDIYRRLRAAYNTSRQAQDYIKIIWTVAPFFGFVAVKLLMDEFLQCVRCFGGWIMLLYGNHKFVRCVRREEQENYYVYSKTLLMIILFTYLSSNHILTIDDYSTYDVLTYTTHNKPYTLTHTVKIVFLTGYFVKLCTILVKQLFFLLPSEIISHSTKRRLYQTIEYISQAYCITFPTAQWLSFFMGANSEEPPLEYFLTHVLISLGYAYFKIRRFMEAYFELKTSILELTEMHTKPDRQEIENAQICPICRDEFRQPYKLYCLHIFCTDCINAWFEKTRTCPICREHAPLSNNIWYTDGATSQLIPFW